MCSVCFPVETSLEPILALTVAASNNLSCYGYKAAFSFSLFEAISCEFSLLSLNKLKILEFDSNKTKECLVLSSFIAISIFVVLAYDF